jgi:hypothetical protein
VKKRGVGTIKLVLQDTRIDDALARCIAIEERFHQIEEQVRLLIAKVDLVLAKRPRKNEVSAERPQEET